MRDHTFKIYNSVLPSVSSILDRRISLILARDTVFKQLAERPADDEARTPLCDLAAIFLNAVESGNLEDEELTRSLEKVYETHGDWRGAYGFFAGFFLATRGEMERAIEQWTVPARVSSRTWVRTLAWVWLRDADVDPIHLENRDFAAMLYRPVQAD